MHELTVAQSIIDSAEELACKEKGKKVISLALAIGAISGVVKESIDFCLNLASKGTMLEGCNVTIEEIPLRVRCKQCCQESNPQIYLLHCQHCQSTDVEIISGKELKITQMEVE